VVEASDGVPSETNTASNGSEPGITSARKDGKSFWNEARIRETIRTSQLEELYLYPWKLDVVVNAEIMPGGTAHVLLEADLSAKDIDISSWSWSD
jgi:hypothetical protein